MLYVLALAGWLTGPTDRVRRAIRVVWTLGCVCFLSHVVAAFSFHHGWSHEAAYRETARQTAAMFGVESGGGIYFNYVFTAVWAGDVLWWWIDGEGYGQRPRWLSAVLHGFLAFMFINGAIVFASGAVRWFGLMTMAGLIGLWALRR